MKHKLYIIIVLLATRVAFATTYFVAPNGKDTNSGLKIMYPITFQKAADLVMPGDIVYVRGGHYYPPARNTYTPIMKFTRQGGSASGGYVKFIKYPNDVADAVLHPYVGNGKVDSSGSWSLIKVCTSKDSHNVVPQYLHFEGLVLRGYADEIKANESFESQPGAYCYDANHDGLVNDNCKWTCPDDDNDHVPDGCEWVRYNGQGLLVTGPFAWDPDLRPLVNRQIFDQNGRVVREVAGLNNYAIPHHITVKNCTFTNFPGAGMSFQRTDYITVEGCTVANNCWYTVFGSSGINFYQFVPSNFETPQYNNGEYRNKIVNNIVYGNTLKVKNQNLVVRYDGNGVIVDDFYHAQDYDPDNTTTFPNRGNIKYGCYKGRTLVSNNILFGNGGSGLKVYSTQYVDVFHNTLFNNGIGEYRRLRAGNTKDSTKLGELIGQASLFVQSIVDEESQEVSRPIVAKGYNRIFNNLTYNTLGYPFEYDAQYLDYSVALDSLDGNLAMHNVHGVDPHFESIIGTNIEIGVPYEVKPPVGLFALKKTSIAINYGMKLWDGAPATESSIAYDRLRYTRDILPDAGAYEIKSCISNIAIGTNYSVIPKDVKARFSATDRTLHQSLRSVVIRDVMDIRPEADGVYIAEIIKSCYNKPNPLAKARIDSEYYDLEETTEDIDALETLIYPNPVRNGILYFSKPVSGFQVFSSSGQLCLTGVSAEKVALQGLPQGLYIIRIDGTGHTFVIE